MLQQLLCNDSLIIYSCPTPPPFQKQVGKLFYHISLWKNISRDSDSLIGGQILEIHVSFPILFELWFDTFFSLFSGAPEPSEVKMHRRSVVYFGRESLGL